MLLVALVALGSATFAWFTSNPYADASGLHLKATAAKGLVIMTGSAIQNASKSKSVDADWVHTDYLNSNSSRNATIAANESGGILNVDAASLDRLANPKFYTTTSADDNSATGDPTAAVSAIAPSMASGGVYSEEIWTKITGTADDTTNIQITSIAATIGNTAKDIKKALRMAVYYNNGTTNKYIGEYAFVEARTNNHITAIGTGDNAKYGNDATKKASGTAALIPSGNVALGTCDNTGSCKLTVYFYLDGEDEECYTNNVDLNRVLDGVTINLGIVPTP
jgi:hypothetical protein